MSLVLQVFGIKYWTNLNFDKMMVPDETSESAKLLGDINNNSSHIIAVVS